MVPVLRSNLTLTELTELEAGASPQSARLDRPSASPAQPPPLPTVVGDGSDTTADTDEDAPYEDEESPGPQVPPMPKRAQWEDLGRLIRANPPANLPESTDELAELLLELERLMLETRLWRPVVHTNGEVAPLDASAGKLDRGPWRQMGRDHLKAFATRAIMVAGTAFADHRFGIEIIHYLEHGEATAP